MKTVVFASCKRIFVNRPFVSFVFSTNTAFQALLCGPEAFFWHTGWRKTWTVFADCVFYVDRQSVPKPFGWSISVVLAHSHEKSYTLPPESVLLLMSTVFRALFGWCRRVLLVHSFQKWCRFGYVFALTGTAFSHKEKVNFAFWDRIFVDRLVFQAALVDPNSWFGTPSQETNLILFPKNVVFMGIVSQSFLRGLEASFR